MKWIFAMWSDLVGGTVTCRCPTRVAAPGSSWGVEEGLIRDRALFKTCQMMYRTSKLKPHKPESKIVQGHLEMKPSTRATP